MELNNKLGSCYEDLSEEDLININGGASPTITSSGWCLAASAAVSAGLGASITFAISAYRGN